VFIVAEPGFSTKQCKPPATPWCNNLSIAGKRSVRIKLPLSRIQYLREVPGFRSADYKHALQVICCIGTEDFVKVQH